MRDLGLGIDWLREEEFPFVDSQRGETVRSLRKTNRRGFLVSTLGTAALLYREAGAHKTTTTHWALLSDTHIAEDLANEYRGFRPSENLRTVVSQIAAVNPAGVVIAGDTARLEGKSGDYRQLKTLLQPIRPRIPVAVALGNTDNRSNFFREFTVSPGVPGDVKDKHIRVIEAGPVRYILLDSLLQTKFSPGLLGKAQRIWLAQYLDSAAVIPTLLFVHHTLDDRDISLLDVERMLRIIRPHPMVKAIVHGHSHRYQFDVWNGIQLINLPAVAYNFRESDPVGWVEARITGEGADFRLHTVTGNTADNGKETSLRWRG